MTPFKLTTTLFAFVGVCDKGPKVFPDPLATKVSVVILIEEALPPPTGQELPLAKYKLFV